MNLFAFKQKKKLNLFYLLTLNLFYLSFRVMGCYFSKFYDFLNLTPNITWIFYQKFIIFYDFLNLIYCHNYLFDFLVQLRRLGLISNMNNSYTRKINYLLTHLTIFLELMIIAIGFSSLFQIAPHPHKFQFCVWFLIKISFTHSCTKYGA